MAGEFVALEVELQPQKEVILWLVLKHRLEPAVDSAETPQAYSDRPWPRTGRERGTRQEFAEQFARARVVPEREVFGVVILFTRSTSPRTHSEWSGAKQRCAAVHGVVTMSPAVDPSEANSEMTPSCLRALFAVATEPSVSTSIATGDVPGIVILIARDPSGL